MWAKNTCNTDLLFVSHLILDTRFISITHNVLHEPESFIKIRYTARCLREFLPSLGLLQHPVIGHCPWSGRCY